MNRKLLDILACHIAKSSPLALYENKSDDAKITTGALSRKKCPRFFPIIDEIPIMLPDELRNKKQDIELLKGNINELPEKIVTQGLPWHL